MLFCDAQYKYLVDGQWLTSPVEPITSDGQVSTQSLLAVTPWQMCSCPLAVLATVATAPSECMTVQSLSRQILPPAGQVQQSEAYRCISKLPLEGILGWGGSLCRWGLHCLGGDRRLRIMGHWRLLRSPHSGNTDVHILIGALCAGAGSSEAGESGCRFPLVLQPPGRQPLPPCMPIVCALEHCDDA